MRLRMIKSRRVIAGAVVVAALGLAGCADQDASYIGARAMDQSQQSGLGNPDRDRPIVMTPPPESAVGGEAPRYQWNGNPQRVIEGKGATPGAKRPQLQPQPPPQAAGVRTSVPTDSEVIEVQTGDTLHGIAERYGVTVASLNQANALSGAPLRPGQKLVLPAAAR